MLLPANYTIHATRNSTWARCLDFEVDEGEVLDLIGWTGALQVRNFPGEAGPALLTLSKTNVIMTEGIYFDHQTEPGQRQWVQIQINNPSIDALVGTHVPEINSPQRFFYDLILEDRDGEQYRMMEGEFLVWPGVSRIASGAPA